MRERRHHVPRRAQPRQVQRRPHPQKARDPNPHLRVAKAAQLRQVVLHPRRHPSVAPDRGRGRHHEAARIEAAARIENEAQCTNLRAIPAGPVCGRL